MPIDQLDTTKTGGPEGATSRAPGTALALRPATGSPGAIYMSDDFGVLAVQARRARFIAAHPHMADRVLGRRPSPIVSKTHAITVNCRTGERTIQLAPVVEVAPPAPRETVKRLPAPVAPRPHQQHARFTAWQNRHGINAVIDACAKHWSVAARALIAPVRFRRIVVPRHAAMKLMADVLHISNPAIGWALGRRDHTTCLSGIKRAGVLLETDPDFAAKYAAALAEVKKGEPA